MKFIVTLILACSALPAYAMEPAPNSNPVAMEVNGRLENRRLNEISGIAVSRRYDNLLWGVNDSGHRPEIFAFDYTGADRGSVTLRGARNVDWEDLASFELDGVAYLLIADTGDNQGRRSISYLWLLTEPEQPDAGLYGGEATIVARIPFRFADGPHDCEAVSVDVRGGRVLLATKRDVPALVYELPLTLTSSRPLTARRIAQLDALPRPSAFEMLESPLLGPWRHQPTAMDIDDNGVRLALATYQNVYIYRRGEGQDWREAFANRPQVVHTRLSQTESLTFLENRILTVAEGAMAPIMLSDVLTD